MKTRPLPKPHKNSRIKKKLKDNNFSFGDIIPVLLTDNGGEFSIVSAFEDDEFGNRETNLFFCEPSSPNEKPEIEKTTHCFVILFRQDILSMLLRNKMSI